MIRPFHNLITGLKMFTHMSTKIDHIVFGSSFGRRRMFLSTTTNSFLGVNKPHRIATISKITLTG